MNRYVDINEITDGNLYTEKDLVKIGCNDCNGCSSCCKGMGNSIVIDPFDAYNLCKGLGKSFDALLSDEIMLTTVDGLILPCLKLDDTCHFLDEKGRCTIHDFRPGICRLFPLGRLYKGDGFYYVLQSDECLAKIKTKVKIKNWLGYADLNAYNKFVLSWHAFIKKAENIAITSNNEKTVHDLCIVILNKFYRANYTDFEKEFYLNLNLITELIS